MKLCLRYYNVRMPLVYPAISVEPSWAFMVEEYLNQLVISVTLSVDRDKTDDAYLDFNLTVDDHYPHPPDSYLDPVALVQSATLAGYYNLFVCSCGAPECIGADVPISVFHDSQTVRWKMRDPYAWNSDEPLPSWSREVEVIFDRLAYVDCVDKALGQAKSLIRHWNGPGSLWVGPGDMRVEQLLDLDVVDPAVTQDSVKGRALH